MAYQPNIPLATDRLKDSQADIQGNFQELNAYLNVNHTAIDGTADQGKHKFVTMPIQGAAPGTLANELAMYSRLSAFTGQNEVFIQRSSNGPEMQVTGATVSGTLLAGNSQGYLPLGNGYMIKWFMPTPFDITMPSLSNEVRNFSYPNPGNIPSFTETPFYVNATLVSSSNPQIISVLGPENTASQVSIGVHNPFLVDRTFNNVRTLVIAIGR